MQTEKHHIKERNSATVKHPSPSVSSISTLFLNACARHYSDKNELCTVQFPWLLSQVSPQCSTRDHYLLASPLTLRANNLAASWSGVYLCSAVTATFPTPSSEQLFHNQHSKFAASLSDLRNSLHAENLSVFLTFFPQNPHNLTPKLLFKCNLSERFYSGISVARIQGNI